jgi:hypothetical protein
MDLTRPKELGTHEWVVDIEWISDHPRDGNAEWRHRANLKYAEVLIYSARMPDGARVWEIRPKSERRTTCQGEEHWFENAKTRALLVYQALFTNP